MKKINKWKGKWKNLKHQLSCIIFIELLIDSIADKSALRYYFMRTSRIKKEKKKKNQVKKTVVWHYKSEAISSKNWLANKYKNKTKNKR